MKFKRIPAYKKDGMFMFAHIIWDFDGTLFNTYPAMSSAFRDMLKAYLGIDESIDEIYSLMKVSMGGTFRAYSEKYKLGDNFFDNYNRQRYEYELQESKPLDGIFDLCRHIHDCGAYNYLFTHRDLTALSLLEKFGMLKFFTDFVTHADGFESKPSPQAINYIMEKHKIAPKSAIMAGDREIDILSAKNAGIASVLITESTGVPTCADYVVGGAKDLYSILGLNKD